MTVREGGCMCGQVRYQAGGEALHVTLCHCEYCRASSGAPVVAWAAFMEDQFSLLQGEPKTFNSSGESMRSFCAACGTGLVYRNAQILPGIVDVQVATFDEPESLPPMAHIQAAEQLGWMKTSHELHAFDRYPPQP